MPRRVLALLSLATLLVAGAASAAELGVVVTSASLDADAVSEAETELRRAVERLASGDLLPRETTSARPRESSGCSLDDLACLVVLGEKLGVSHLLVVAYEPPALEAVHVDVRARAVVGNMTATAPRLAAGTARRVARALLAPGTAGALSLRVEPAEAKLFVDGEQVEAGLVAGLAMGEHEVTAELPGFEPASQTALVAPRATTDVEVRLSPGAAATREVSPWLVGGASAATAGLLLAVVAGVAALAPGLSTPAAPGQEAARKSLVGSSRVLSASLGALAGLAVVGGVGASAYSFVE